MVWSTFKKAASSRPAILALCALILVLSKPDQFLHPQFWAEDGSFYLTHYLRGWHTLFEPYAGYLNVVLWLIAGTAWWWNPVWAPSWFVACSVGIVLYVASRAISSRQPLAGPIIALAIVCVPDAFELLANGANSQWFVAVGLVLLLSSRDPTNVLQVLHDLIVALAGLTGPFSILLAPLFLWRSARRRTLWSFLLAAVVLAAACVQLGFILQAPTPAQVAEPCTATDAAGVVGARIAGSLFAGGLITGNTPPVLRWAFAILTVTLVVAAAARPGPRREGRIWLAVAFAVLLAAGLYRCRLGLAGMQAAVGGARYFYQPQLILLWLVALSLRDVRRAWRRGAAALLVLAFATNVARLREPPYQDMHWREYASKIRAGTPMRIPLNPPPMSITFPAHQPF